MGAFLVTYPRDRIRSLLVIFIFVRVTYIPAVLLIGVWFLTQFANLALWPSSKAAWRTRPTSVASSSELSQHDSSRVADATQQTRHGGREVASCGPGMALFAMWRGARWSGLRLPANLIVPVLDDDDLAALHAVSPLYHEEALVVARDVVIAPRDRSLNEIRRVKEHARTLHRE